MSFAQGPALEAQNLSGFAANASSEFTLGNEADGLSFLAGMANGGPFTGARDDAELVSFPTNLQSGNAPLQVTLNALNTDAIVFLNDYGANLQGAGGASVDPTTALNATIAHALSNSGLM